MSSERPNRKSESRLVKARTAATADLIKRYGQPVRKTVDGVTMLLWSADPKRPRPGLYADGDGIHCARLSSEDLKGYETALGQIHPQLELAALQKLRPRAILVTVDNSGARWFENRPDFNFIVRSIRRGWCRWVMWSKADRIARVVLEAEIFYDYLHRTGTTLWLQDRTHPIDWVTDRLYLQIQDAINAEEAQRIKLRMHGALHRQFLQQHRPWPGAHAFATVRDPESGDIKFDLALWPLIEKMVFGLADHHGGLASFAAAVSTSDVPIGESRLRSVVTNPLYVFGSWIQEVEGEPHEIYVANRSDVDLIPIEVFERNQRLLAQRRGSTKLTPVGTFLFGTAASVTRRGPGIPVYHARCMHLRDAKGRTPVLKSRTRGGYGIQPYSHYPFTPETCRGWGGVDKEALEVTVVKALRRLARNPEEQHLWREIARTEYAARSQAELELEGIENAANPQRALAKTLRDVLDKSLRSGSPAAALTEAARILSEADRAELVGDVAPRLPFARSEFWHEIDEERLLRVFLRVVVEPKTQLGNESRIALAQVMEACISKIVIDDDETGPSVRIFGPLVPKDFAGAAPTSPIQAACLELESFLRVRRRPRSKGGRPNAQTAPQAYPYDAVCAFRALAAMDANLVPAWVSPPLSLKTGRIVRGQPLKRAGGPLPRRPSMTVPDLMEAGWLTPGESIVLIRSGGNVQATLNADGTVDLEGTHLTSVSKAAQVVRRVPAQDGWKDWFVRRGEESLSLEAIRTRAEAAQRN